MSLRAFLTACIAIGMHSSVCTGGVFAITAAIADQAAYQTDETGPMSYGAIGYLSCKSTTKAKTVEATNQEPGCGDATTCLTRVSAHVKSSLFVPLGVVDSGPSFIEEVQYTVAYSDIATALARDGPLYEHSLYVAKHTEKLE